MIEFLKKFDFLENTDLFFSLPTKNIFSSALELELSAFIGKFSDSKETIIYTKQKHTDREINYILSFPVNDNLENYFFKDFSDKEIELLEKKYFFKKNLYLQTFFYDTQKFINKLKKTKDVKRFEKKYKCKIAYEYDFEKVLILFNEWKTKITEKGLPTPDLEHFKLFFKKDVIQKFNVKFFYFEIDDKLVGLKIAFPYYPDCKDLFVMRYQCSLHEYFGINQYMSLKVAEYYSLFLRFTDGGEFTDVKFLKRREHKLLKRIPDEIQNLYKLKILQKM